MSITEVYILVIEVPREVLTKRRGFNSCHTSPEEGVDEKPIVCQLRERFYNLRYRYDGQINRSNEDHQGYPIQRTPAALQDMVEEDDGVCEQKKI